MTSQQKLIDTIVAETGLSAETVDRLCEATSAVITDALCEGDSVALPAFGTFSTNKTDEYTTRDNATGDLILMPPAINVIFSPAHKLTKAAVGEKGDVDE